MFKKLRTRFALLNMVLLSVVMIAAFAVIYGITSANIAKENQARLRTAAAFGIAARQMIFPDTGGSPDVLYVAPRDAALSFHLVVDEEGRLVGVRSYVELPQEIYGRTAELALNSGGETGVIPLDGKRWLFLRTDLQGSVVRRAAFGLQEDYVIAARYAQFSFLDITESQQILTRLLFTCGAIGVLMLFVILGISVLFAKRATAPIETMYEKQRQFITDASHELKTPLAVISANADVLLADRRNAAREEKWAQYIKAETERMGKLVGGLLCLARAEGGGAETRPANLSEIVCDAALSMEAVAYEKGLTLTQRIEPDIVLNSDGDRLAQVVGILLDNAIKYADENGHVEIALKRGKQKAVFSIRNTGEGIPAAALPRIFDRFYRADPARARDGSYGLGLPIAKAVIEGLGGKIYAESAEGESATFTFSLDIIR